ncbi:MAG: hypothetical protein H6735_17760 [Alphaproteobacteria bacterium]|nr:hypothetical protein [Alphaproteobacteria bacterium]
MDRAVVALALLAGCVDPGAPGRLVDVVSAPGATGEGYRDVALATNGVRGGGRWAGGTDVFTLGDDELVLGVGEPLFDGEGDDLVVFENPFDVRGGEARFMDPAVVEVSADCERFVAFPHAYLAADPAIYEPDPSLWAGFAGVAPVLLDEDTGELSPFDEDAGGDRFDLADVDDDAIRTEGVRCVRITAATSWEDPSTGLPYPVDPISDGPDVDGIYVRR